ncbi:hypothetical protein C8R45DRAFT_1159583 [Mycena sanguinolenta]|nr:hypothetical protein C8R45DRAFT_1159583 [Mycena sanguinolenta]
MSRWGGRGFGGEKAAWCSIRGWERGRLCGGVDWRGWGAAEGGGMCAADWRAGCIGLAHLMRAPRTRTRTTPAAIAAVSGVAVVLVQIPRSPGAARRWAIKTSTPLRCGGVGSVEVEGVDEHPSPLEHKEGVSDAALYGREWGSVPRGARVTSFGRGSRLAFVGEERRIHVRIRGRGTCDGGAGGARSVDCALCGRGCGKRCAVCEWRARLVSRKRTSSIPVPRPSLLDCVRLEDEMLPIPRDRPSAVRLREGVVTRGRDSEGAALGCGSTMGMRLLSLVVRRVWMFVQGLRLEAYVYAPRPKLERVTVSVGSVESLARVVCLRQLVDGGLDL